MWVHPEVPNPEYEADDNLYLYEDFGSIGIDIWQVQIFVAPYCLFSKKKKWGAFSESGLFS